MIVANALRIGNLVNYENKIITIDSIHGDRESVNLCIFEGGWGDAGSVDDVKLKDISPITLTEEWLLRFGFVKIGEEYHIAYNSFLISGRFRVELERHFVLLGKIIVARCKYVHELQNLFYAILKEELTLKTT